MSKGKNGKKNDLLEQLLERVSKHQGHGQDDDRPPPPPRPTHGDDVLLGGEGRDKLVGLKGNDFLSGGGGNDKLVDNKGDDTLLGGAGNDLLVGGKDDDVLDGGAGSDRIVAGKDDDRAIYAWGDHLGPDFQDLGTKDRYDGGKGFDTLELRLTSGEAALPAVQADIEAFNAHLGSRHKHGWFEFSSFGLKAKGFEKLEVVIVNVAPTAVADAGATDEDTLLLVMAPGVLANDSDPDHLDVIRVQAGATTSAMGAAVVLFADGGYSYDPAGIPGIQSLALGESAPDSFEYTIVDLAGASASAVVTITVAGLNDAPEAGDDTAATDEDSVLAGTVLLANDTDIDNGAVLSALPAALTTGKGALVVVNADGSYSYDPNGQFETLGVGAQDTDGFTYTVTDEHGALDVGEVFVTIEGVNDAPVAADDSAATRADQTVAGNVLSGENGGADFDIDFGDTLTVAAGAFSTTKGALLTLADDGGFVYDPTDSQVLQDLAAGATTLDSFLYTVSDGNGGSAQATLEITVTGAPDEPPPPQGAGDALAGGSQIAPSVPPEAALEYYMRIQGLDGGHAQDWVRLESFGVSFENAISFSIGGGAGASVPEFEPGVFRMGNSGYATELLQHAVTGTHLQELVVVAGTFNSKLGAFQSTDSFTFNDVFVSSVHTDGEAGANAHEVAFRYGEIERAHKAASFGWDVVANAPTGSGGLEPAPSSPNILDIGTSGAYEYYVRFEGQDWLELEAFSLGVQVPVSIGGGGGGIGTGKPSFEHVQLSLGGSEELIALNEALAAGDQFQWAEIEVYAPGGKLGDTQLVDEYRFEKILITELDSPAPNENTASFNFTKIEHLHLPTKVSTGWDVQNNGSASVADQGDFIPADLAPSVPPEAALEYYMRIQGVDGGHAQDWVRLESFGVSFENAISFSIGGGAGASAPEFEPGVFRMGNSGYATELLQHAVTGTHLQELVVVAGTFNSKLGAFQSTDSFTFNDVFVSSVHTDGEAGANAHEVAFRYGEIERAHKAASFGWDVGDNAPTGSGGLEPAPSSPNILDIGTSGAYEYYVRFEGQDWLELEAFSLGVQVPVSIGGGGGGIGTGKPSFEHVQLSLGGSEELIALNEALASGDQFQWAEIEVYAPGGKLGDTQLVDEYRFEKILITELDSPAPNENTASFNFTKIEHLHLPTKVSTGWDVQNNGSASVADQGDFIPADLAPSVPPEAALEYYMRIQGLDGGHAQDWVRLESFGVSFENAISFSIGGGAGASAPEFEPGVFRMGNSGYATELLQHAVTGTHLQELVVVAGTFNSKLGAFQSTDSFTFNDVFVSSVHTDGEAGANAHEVAFRYGEIERAHKAASFGWDVVANAPTGGGGLEPAPSSPNILDIGTSGAYEYYVRFEGQDWLELEAFSLGVQVPVSIGGGGGGIGTGKPSFEHVRLSLGGSEELIALNEALASGDQFQWAEIEVYAPGGKLGDTQLVNEYRFEDVFITGVDSPAPNDNAVSFIFDQFEQEYLPTNVQMGYDLDAGTIL